MGDFLFCAGDMPLGLYGLRRGSVEVRLPLIAGEQVSLLRMNEGFWIGDGALLTNVPRLISVVAAEDSSFLYLPSDAVFKLLEDAPHHWRSFHDLATRNAHLTAIILAEALSLTVRARVCRLLLTLSKNRVEAHITQDGLAKTLGIARPTLRRCLADLSELGAIENRYKRIGILDRSLLETYENEQ